MKNINKLMSLVFAAGLIAVSFTSCEDEEKQRIPQFTNGGFVKFVTTPEFNAGANPETAAFVADVEDPSENVASYTVRVLGTFAGAPVDTLAFSSTTTFPFGVGFTGADMATLYNVPITTFEEGDTFEFFATVVNVDGVVYDGAVTQFIPATDNGDLEPGDPGYIDPTDPAFVPEPGQWNGANSDGVLTTALGLLAAFNWTVTFEDPEE